MAQDSGSAFANARNNTASPIRRGSVEVFLAYDVDLPRALAIMEETTRQTAGVLETREITLPVRALGQNDIAIEVRFWTDSRRADFLATTSLVAQRTLLALKSAGIALPDPTVRSLIPRNPDAWRTIAAKDGTLHADDPSKEKQP